MIILAILTACLAWLMSAVGVVLGFGWAASLLSAWIFSLILMSLLILYRWRVMSRAEPDETSGQRRVTHRIHQGSLMEPVGPDAPTGNAPRGWRITLRRSPMSGDIA